MQVAKQVAYVWHPNCNLQYFFRQKLHSNLQGQITSCDMALRYRYYLRMVFLNPGSTRIISKFRIVLKMTSRSEHQVRARVTSQSNDAYTFNWCKCSKCSSNLWCNPARCFEAQGKCTISAECGFMGAVKGGKCRPRYDMF